MSLSPGSIGRIGKVFSGSQNLDDMVRDLRLSPVLQLGFSPTPSISGKGIRTVHPASACHPGIPFVCLIR